MFGQTAGATRVKVNGGVPVLKDLPVIGWVFSTESESTKKSQLIVVADCEVVTSTQALPSDIVNTIKTIKDENKDFCCRITFSVDVRNLFKL